MGGHKRTKGKNSLLYLATTAVMLIMTFPFVYLVLHSFAAWDQVAHPEQFDHPVQHRRQPTPEA